MANTTSQQIHTHAHHARVASRSPSGEIPAPHAEFSATYAEGSAALAEGSGQSVEMPDATASAVRLLSETAHDLRSPLTAIRESVRLVRDGDLGPLNDDQRDLLGEAISQCDCMNHLVDDLVQLDRLRRGFPRVHRGWLSPAQVRHAVDQSLRPWTLPRRINLVWDGFDNLELRVFADAQALRRLIVNLVGNAIRVSRDGESVMIQVRRVRDGDAVEWSVLDRGKGMSESDLQRIGSRQWSATGGEGLGLMICRQIAASHFSSLSIRSRLTAGTEVSFETPAAGPKSVAACWMRWRRKFGRKLATQQDGQLTMIEPGTHRVRRPQGDRLKLPATMIEIGGDGPSPRCSDTFSIGTVTLGAAMSRHAADRFDTLFQRQLGIFDLAYRIDSRRWVCIFDADRSAVVERIEMTNREAASEIGSVRLDWSDPQSLPIHSRRTQAVVSDLLVRQTLSCSSSTGFLDNNEARPGTNPILPSVAAARRLDAEVRRLLVRWKSQSAALREQAQRLRPIDA